MFLIGTLLLPVSLLFPGWSIAPFRGLLESRLAAAVPGLQAQLGTGILQWRIGDGLIMESSDLLLSETNGRPTIAMGAARLRFPVRRILSARLLPAEIRVEDLHVWMDVDQQGTLQLPPWLLALLQTDPTSPPPPDKPLPPLRLSALPAFLKMEPGERMEIAMERYAAHIRQSSGEQFFVLPSLFLNLEGTPQGALIDWHSEGWELQNQSLLEGSVTVDVPGEFISWQNRFHLPLTPALADWLKAAFPYLPVPPFFQTAVHLQSHGTIDLVPATMSANGELQIDGGSIQPGQAGPAITIPDIRNAFQSDFSWSPPQPQLDSRVDINIGPDAALGRINVQARLHTNPAAVDLQSTGQFDDIGRLLQLLPPQWRPIDIKGNLQWDSTIDAASSNAGTLLNRGSLSVQSNGIQLHFTEDDLKPLQMAPFRFAAKVEDSGQRIRMEPFTFSVGPLTLRSSGLDWQRATTAQPAQGWVELAPLTAGDLLAQLPDSLADALPETLRPWIRAFQLDQLRFDFSLHPSNNPAVPIESITVRPQWKIAHHHSSLSGNGTVSLQIPRQEAQWSFSVDRFPMEDFLPPMARQVAIPRLFPELTFAGTADWPRRSADFDAVCRIHGEALYPGPELRHIWTQPVALEKGEFRLQGKLAENFAASLNAQIRAPLLHASLSAKASCPHLEGIPTPPLALNASANLQSVATAVFLDAVDPQWLASLPLSRSEILDFSLRHLQTEAQIQLTDFTTAARLLIDQFQLDGDFATGAESLRFAVEGATMEDQTTVFQARLQPWDVGRSDLRIAQALPIPLATVSLPLTAEAALRIAHPIQLNQISRLIPATSLKATASIPTLRVNQCRFLAAPVHMSDLQASADLQLDPVLLSKAAFTGRFMQAPFSVDVQNLTPFPEPAGSITASLSDLHSDWIPDRLPADLLPETLRPWLAGLSLRGRLQSASLSAVLGPQNAHPDVPFLESLQFSLNTSAAQIQSNQIPPLQLDSLQLSGDLNAISLHLTSLGHPAAYLTEGSVSLRQPLHPSPHLSTELHFASSLAAIPKLIAHTGLDPEKQLRQFLDQNGLTGHLSGSLKADYQNGFKAQGDLDLAAISTAFPFLARNFSPENPASLSWNLSAHTGSPSPEPISAAFSLSAKAFPIGHFSLRLDSSIAPPYTAPLYGLQHANVHFSGLDQSDFTITCRTQQQQPPSFSFQSNQLDMGPLLTLLEPAVLHALSSPPESSAAAPSTPSPSPQPTNTSPAPPNWPTLAIPLPDLDLAVDIAALRFGHQFLMGPLHLHTSFRQQWLHALDFSLLQRERPLRLNIKKQKDTLNLSFHLRDLGSWLEAALRPTRLWQSPEAVASPALLSLQSLPDYITKGDLRIKGSFSRLPQPNLHLQDLSLAGLTLQTEVPFLTRIAALVNRKVVLQVPFRSFSCQSLVASPQAVDATTLRMEGPINLDLESIHYEFPNKNTHVVGKVFGFGFEVVGTAPQDLSFYLLEKNTAVQAITSEDDFEW